MILKAELRKYFNEVKAYYPDHIVGIIVSLIFFTGVFYGFNNVNSHLYIGFFMWYFSSIIISESSMSISEEKQQGTFEQLITKPTSLLKILSIRTIVWLLFFIIKSCILFFVISTFMNVSFKFDILLMPIFIMVFISMYGISLLLSSLTLIYTKTASFEGIISYILLFFTGSLIPIDSLPTLIQDIAKFLPLTLGNEIATMLLDGYIIETISWIKLIVVSFIYLIIGLVIFNLVSKHIRKSGYSQRY